MSEATLPVVRNLLEKAGFVSDAVFCFPLAGGRNNRTYRLETPGGTVLLKHYYRGGDWDRLAAESRFLRFCEKMGVRRVPRLLAEDAANGYALHSWLDGARLNPLGLDGDEIDEAADFLGELTQASRMKGLDDIPPARDACLCLEDCFRSPRERLAALEHGLRETSSAPLSKAALAFVEKRLVPIWHNVHDSVLFRLEGINLFQPLPIGILIVSPSDFGFHNALRLRNGTGLAFIDFEYAGLDDPAKAISDFICQADYSPTPETLEKLGRTVCENDRTFKKLVERVEILLPLFRVKFCCIMLNDFKHFDAARRRFALGDGADQKMQEQLARAIAYADRFLP